MGYYVKVEPGVRLFVEDVNPEGREAIVFLHGWPASHKMFEYQYERLACQGFRCVGIDARGFGDSDKPLTGYCYDRQADDTLAVVEALGLDGYTLAGHSTGGGVAVRFAARHGGCGLARLVLLAAAAPSLIERPCFPYGLKREEVEQIIKQTLEDRPAMLRGFGDMFFFQYVTQPFMEWFFQMGLQAAGWSTAAVAEAWLDEERLFADLGEVRVPTLILHGIHDRVCHFPLAVAQHEGIAGSRLVPFKYSGHGLVFDERDKVSKEIAQFVAEC